MVTPMSTTSLKLPTDIKKRAAAAARRQGVSPHAFMVEAIRSAAAAAEKRAEFVGAALAAREEMRESGKGYRAAEVHAYLSQRAEGKPAKRPKAKPWRK